METRNWACLRCTLSNEPTARACAACDTERPPATPVAAAPVATVVATHGDGGDRATNATVDTLAARLAEAEAEIERMRDEQCCPVCMDRNKGTVLGCGHFLCSECAVLAAANTCPTCRKPVTQRITTYE